MKKLIILDVDGVTILPREKYLKDRLMADFGIEPKEVAPLFENDYIDCVLGRKDLKEVLKLRYLPSWGWKGSVEQFLRYWWQSEETPNFYVLDLIKKNRNSRNKFCLLMEQEKYRARHLLNEVGLKQYFDFHFISSSYGLSKTDPNFLELILKKLQINAEHCGIWDDNTKNLIAPKSLGIKSYLFTDNARFEKDLNLFLR